MPLRMKDRIALITGGGTGMGAAIAQIFAHEGAEVIIIGRREEKLSETVKKIEYQGFRANYICGDVSNLEEVKNVFDSIEQSHGVIDALVNTAGVINSALENPTETTEHDWDWLMDINIKGVFYTSKHFIKTLLRNSKKGTIVNIASICAHQGCPGYATYSASKGAVTAYTKAMAGQYGEYGIRVNCISPGVVHTPMSYVEMPDFDSRVESFDKSHPLGRVGKPEDVAYAALYFSCQESSWVTGQDLIVDGGWTLGD